MFRARFESLLDDTDQLGSETARQKRGAVFRKILLARDGLV